jgi:D-ribose pyranose/furanose isomerase RbsD
MTAEFTSSSDKNISYENIAQIQGTTNWTLYKKIVPVPTDAKKIRVMLALAQTNGSVFYDDVKVITLSGEEYNKIMQASASPKTVEVTEENLTFNNGNFEAELKNWNGSGTISTTDKKEGNSCATINSTVNQWTAIDQTAAIPEGTKSIEISGWLKAKNIKQGTETWNNGMFIAEFTSDGKNKTTTDQLIGTVTSSSDWTFFQKKITIPEGTKKYRIMLALSTCTGTLLADDIQVKMLQE